MEEVTKPLFRPPLTPPNLGGGEGAQKWHFTFALRVFSEKRTRDFGACRVGIEDGRKEAMDNYFTAFSA
jgi:hypothetical protein